MSAFVLHGHFYQPPRENPWTETVPREVSAGVFHDWNERITAECYRPNAYAQIVDGRNRVVSIVNNYSLMSFDLGPTLARWLEVRHPEVMARIIEADATSHTAIAHPYHHSILPLATERDARTEIRWGIAAFRHRFGRDPEGFWLPETALDESVLSLLIEEGIRFTVVAPTQIGEAPTGMPARWQRSDGRSLDLVVYDGELSHLLAFDMARIRAEALLSEFTDRNHRPLVVGATDGETFGHHHHYTERAVAYAFAVLAPAEGMRTGALAPILAGLGERQQTDVVPSAWSCAHGLGRWQTDCGCSTGGQIGWNQAWRAPLRNALNLLRDIVHEAFERLGAVVLLDPWAARDAYVGVIDDKVRVAAFSGTHLVAGADLVTALTLLELERQALAMYTSCGWFFNDMAGLETVQILRYAARAIDLLVELGEPDPSEVFLAELGRGRSNDPAEGDGRRIWEQRVMSARVGPDRVVAHCALVQLLRGELSATAGAYELRLEHHARTVGASCRVETGRLHLLHRRTRRSAVWNYAVVGDGAYDVTGVVAPEGADGIDAAAFAEALHRIAVWPDGFEHVQAQLLTWRGGRRFGLDVLVADLDPDLAAEVAPGALEALVRRAVSTGHPGHIRAARRYLRSVTASGIEIELAVAQDIYLRAARERTLPGELDPLAWDLGLALGVAATAG